MAVANTRAVARGVILTTALSSELFRVGGEVLDSLEKDRARITSAVFEVAFVAPLPCTTPLWIGVVFIRLVNEVIQAVMPISSVPENLSLFAVGSVEPRVQSALSTVRDRTEVSRYVKSVWVR